MPNSTGITRNLTGHAPVLFIHNRSKASGLALLSWLLLSASGCGGDTGLTPTPLPTTATPTSQASATPVRIEGQVLDEHNQPVEGARVTLLYSATSPAPSATADDAGRFVLTVDWPEPWRGITLRADREGYEFTDVPVQQSAEAIRAVSINMYKSLTITPGTSIHTTLSLQSCDCWFEPFCRRAVVNAASGRLVDVEVIPADGQEYAGVALRDQLALGYNFPNRVTVGGGTEVWIVVRQLGRVKVVATER